MKKITFFYLDRCPHCKKANQFIEELFQEHPEYKNIEITRIEEEQTPEKCAGYDYYYVPCFFYDNKEKAHEGTITKEDMEKVLKGALL